MLERARRSRAERFYACGALERPRAARSTRTLGISLKYCLADAELALLRRTIDRRTDPDGWLR